MRHRRPVRLAAPELPEAGDDEQPPQRGSITEGASVDLVGAVVWIGVFGGCSDTSLHCGSLISLLELLMFLSGLSTDCCSVEI